MFSARLIKQAAFSSLFLAASLLLTACDGMVDDLAPSGEDKRPVVDTSIIGTQVGQITEDFTLQDTLYAYRSLHTELDTPASTTGVVLYFTMWCPICDSHASHMRTFVMPNFPDVQFFLVDYVTGSVANARTAQVDNGYTNIDTLADVSQEVFNLYKASMGTTVVIGSAEKRVRMNEDYKDGVKLIETLQALP